MNSGNSKTSDPHRLLLNLKEVNIKRKDKYVALSNIGMYYTGKNIKKTYENINLKVTSPTRNEKFELSDGTQKYFQYILKNMEK